MAEKKKNVLKEFIKLNKKKTVTLPYKDKKGEVLFEIKVNPNITLAQRSAMIDYICEIVFAEEDRYNIQNYNGRLMTFAKRCATLRFFTDLEMPEDLEVLFDLVMNTTIYEDIVPHIEPTLSSVMCDADETIKTYRNTGIYNYNFMLLAEKVGGYINEFLDKFKDINLEEIKGLLEKTKDLDTDAIVEGILNFKK